MGKFIFLAFLSSLITGAAEGILFYLYAMISHPNNLNISPWWGETISETAGVFTALFVFAFFGSLFALFLAFPLFLTLAPTLIYITRNLNKSIRFTMILVVGMVSAPLYIFLISSLFEIDFIAVTKIKDVFLWGFSGILGASIYYFLGIKYNY